MQSDVTFIIPIFNLKQDRINNLRFILPFILNTGCKTILVEQTAREDVHIGNLIKDLIGDKYENTFQHVLYINNNPLIHKSGMINWVTKTLVTTKYAWVNDVDYYMRFSDVLNAEWKSEFIQPYEIAKKINKEESQSLFEGKRINVEYSDPMAEYISMYGALSFIYSCDAFLKLNGMDESLFGWAKEDEEFNMRLDSKGISKQKIELRGIHLWHPPSESAKPDSTENENDMAILTCHFNWCNFQQPTRNLHKFIKQMAADNVPLYGVELSLTGNFQTEGLENWYQIKVEKENVCFQKEACINLLVSKLPANYTKVAWVDADLTFSNPNWYQDTSSALKKYKAVQMFSLYLYADEDGKVIKKIPSLMKNGGPRKETLTSTTARHLNGVPGGAWAARREMWNYGGLYPYSFVGGGDCAFIYALFGLDSEELIRSILGMVGKNEYCIKFNRWKTQITGYIDRSISHVKGEVIHSWHGDLENKAYNTRHEIYQLVNIDGDIECTDMGILKISSTSDDVYDKIMSYFKNRKEDGELLAKRMRKNKTVVYTCITGEYDSLKEVADPQSNIDYVCFSDKAIVSKTWTVREIPEILKSLSSAKIARCIKIMPHLFFSEYETSVWVDGSIEVLGNTNEFIAQNLKEYFAISKHPHRNCVYDEAVAVLKRQKDTAETVIPQIVKYRGMGYPETHGMVQTGIIIRKHNEDVCKSICNDWWKEVMNGSKRDQLSFNFTIWNKFVNIDIFSPSAFSSQHFQLWSHSYNGISKITPPPNEKFIKNYINGVKV